MRLQVNFYTICFLGLYVFHVAAADDFSQKQRDLIRAIHRGDIKDAENALNAFGSQTSQASIALFAAVRSCRVDMVTLMLSTDIEVDVAQNEKTANTLVKYTPLMQTAEWGLSDIAKMLLDAGADKTITYCSQTAEQIAQDFKHPETAQCINAYRSSENTKKAAKR